MQFCSHVLFLLREQWLIERLCEAMGAALVGNNFSPIPSNFSFHIKKKWLVAARNLQSIETLLTLELSQYSKSGSIILASFLQASWPLPTETAAYSEALCVYARPPGPSDPHKQSRRAASRAWSLILPSKPSITFWNSLQSDCQMTSRGSNLDSNFELYHLTQVYSLRNHSLNCVEFEFYFSLLLMPNLSQAK